MNRKMALRTPRHPEIEWGGEPNELTEEEAEQLLRMIFAHDEQDTTEPEQEA